MNTSLVGSLIAAALISAVNLSIGHLQRKQMRQIELHREDSSVGLVPPPHPLRLFLRKYKLPILNTGVGALLLASGLLSQPPLTRLSVFNIAGGIGCLLLALTNRMVDDVYGALIRIIDLIEKQSDSLSKTTDFALRTNDALVLTLGTTADLARATELLSNTTDMRFEIRELKDRKGKGRPKK
jgi:hypothetical protein